MADVFDFVSSRDAVHEHDSDITRMNVLSHWDSPLITACIEANVEPLYSEDIGDREQQDTLTVVNPFA